MSDSQPVSISQYCGIRSSKRVFAKDYCDSGVPFYRGKEIIEKYNGALSVSTELFISEEKFAELCSKLGAPQPSDLLLTSVGTLGIPYVVSRGERFYFKDGNLTWFHNFNGLDSTYLYYWLVSPTGKAELAKATIGSSQPAFTIVLLKDMQIACPPLPTQRKIASILSAYDDLIENNTRRIAILEEMAQAIYREWFVNFRFPGHENVKLVDSPLGLIPEGWEIAPLNEVADITMGTSPKSSTYNDEGKGTPLVNGPVEFGGNFTQRIKWTTDPKRFCEAGDLVVCVRGSTTGKYVKSDGVYCLGRGVCGIRGKHQTFVDQLFAEQLPSLLLQTGGSTFPSWTGPQLKSHRVLSPPQELVAQFDEHVSPTQQAVYVYSRKNEILRTTRDLLLPKLISGKLDVEDLDIDAGMTAEALEEATA